MPNILTHLAFAEEVLRYIGNRVNKLEFLSGNLIPDLAIDKKASHYRTSASVQGFVVPNMKEVKKELYDKNNSIFFGMYCHLYLDYHFIETYLIPEFTWNKDNMMVINPRNSKSWTVKDFFAKPSEGGILYQGYNELNYMLLGNGHHIKMQTLAELPSILPSTGLAVFDTRKECTWREELNVYLSQNVFSYTGEILAYSRFWNSILLIAEKFIKEEL